MDSKVNDFADAVIGIVTDYDSDFFSNSADPETDREDMKQSIIKLFEMFQPEKKASSVSGYIVYCQEERENVKKQNEGISSTDITKALGAQWKALDDEEKAVYNEKAKAMRPMTTEEKSAKKAASRASSKAPKAKCEFDGCDKCPKEATPHTDGKIYCATHFKKIVVEEKKAEIKAASPKVEAKVEPKKEMKSASKKAEEPKKEMKSVSKKAVEEPKKDAVKSAKENLEKKLEEANKKLAEKKAATEAPKKITTSPKPAAKSPEVKKTTFDFSSKAVNISEDPEFWACKRVNLDKNTEGKRWRYNPSTGLCFEDNDDFELVGTYINGAVSWEVPEEAKNWARKSGCTVNEDEDDDIELDGEFSDEE
jgi:hypothetical protein